jgi:hypothetical protein
MTHYFIESVEDEKIYDEDGILTPGRIQEYVAKKVAQHSSFTQLPVIENRVVGYYPFISKSTALRSVNNETIETLEPSSNNLSTREISFTTPNREAREKLQKISIEFIENAFEAFLSNRFKNYSRLNFKNCDEININGKNAIKSRIVEDAKGKLKSINKVIYIKQEPVYDRYQQMINPMLSVLGKRPEPIEYRDVPEIDFNNTYFNSIDITMECSDIHHVSFGLGAVAYQAKWGGVIAPYFYKIEWDGEKNSQLTSLRKYNYTYLIEDLSVTEIPQLKLQLFEDLEKSIVEWNKERESELEEFKIRKT